MSSLKDTDDVARLADAFERSANWLDNGALDGPARTHPLVGTADYRRASEVLRSLQREVAELAQQRGDLAAKLLEARQLVSVSSIDVEKLIAACVPGGSFCDPQAVADAIRRYCDAWPNVASESQPSEQTR